MLALPDSVWQHTWSHLISAQVPQLHQTANRAAHAASAIAAVLATQQGIIQVLLCGLKGLHLIWD